MIVVKLISSASCHPCSPTVAPLSLSCCGLRDIVGSSVISVLLWARSCYQPYGRRFALISDARLSHEVNPLVFSMHVVREYAQEERRGGESHGGGGEKSGRSRARLSVRSNSETTATRPQRASRDNDYSSQLDVHTAGYSRFIVPPLIVEPAPSPSPPRPETHHRCSSAIATSPPPFTSRTSPSADSRTRRDTKNSCKTC